MPIESGLTFFTSDSRPKYANDVLNVLALPTGTIYRFRYELKYIIPEIRNIFDNLNPHGTRCLIAFRHEASEKNGIAFIVPIRWAHIENIELISDFYIIRFQLNGYPTPSFYGVEKSHIINSSLLYLQSCNSSARNFPVHLGLTSLVEPKQTESRNIWVIIAKSLALHDTFSETHFLRIAGVTNSLNRVLKFSDKKHYLIVEQEYVFVQIDHFALNYFENNAKLKVDSDTNVIRLAGGSNISLDSRYDSHQIWLQARAVAGSTITEVIINTEDERSGAAQTRIALPFMVKRSHRMLIIRIVINTIGAMLVAAPSILGPSSNVGYRILIACLGALILAVGTNLIPSNK